MALNNIKIAILATDGFEQSELIKPKEALEAQGATVKVISPKSGFIKGWKAHNWGDKVKVDVELGNAKAEEFEALILPGGVMNPDHLRTEKSAIEFIKAFIKQGKPIAAICHGPWPLIDAGGVQGRTLTSWPSLKADLSHAGAHWVDKAVVVDKNLITSRQPDDLPVFNQEIIKMLLEK